MKLTTKQLKKIIREEVASTFKGNVNGQITDVVLSNVRRMLQSPAIVESITWDLQGIKDSMTGDSNTIVNEVSTRVAEELRGTIYDLVSEVVREIKA